MRYAVLALFATLLGSSLAAAEPTSTRCYAGSQTAKVGTVSKVFKIVLERTLDPAASELRERAWSSKDPAKERKITAKIDVTTGTFDFEDSEIGVKGKGTLEGKPWHWTAQTMKFTKGKTEVTATSKLDGDTVHSQVAGVTDGKPTFTMTGELTKIDCTKLDEQRAALAK